MMGAMAKTVGKGLAPCLKALAGSWWLAQFDLHAEAAAAARDAFQAAFAGSKQKEALLFTRTEVGIRLFVMHSRWELRCWYHMVPYLASCHRPTARDSQQGIPNRVLTSAGSIYCCSLSAFPMIFPKEHQPCLQCLTVRCRCYCSCKIL